MLDRKRWFSGPRPRARTHVGAFSKALIGPGFATCQGLTTLQVATSPSLRGRVDGAPLATLRAVFATGPGKALAWSPVDGRNLGFVRTRDSTREQALTGLDEAMRSQNGMGGLRVPALSVGWSVGG